MRKAFVLAMLLVFSGPIMASWSNNQVYVQGPFDQGVRIQPMSPAQRPVAGIFDGTALIEGEEAEGWDCHGVLFGDPPPGEGIIEGWCELVPETPPPVRTDYLVCFRGFYVIGEDGSGQASGSYRGFMGPSGGWRATISPEDPVRPNSAWAEGTFRGPGGSANRGQVRGGITWGERPDPDTLARALDCSRPRPPLPIPDPPVDQFGHEGPVSGPPSSDFIYIEWREGSLEATMGFYGAIPQQPQPSLLYRIYFDTDQDPSTGNPFETVGAEYAVEIGYDRPPQPEVWSAELLRSFSGRLMGGSSHWGLSSSGVLKTTE